MEQKKTEGRKSTSDDNVPFCIEIYIYRLKEDVSVLKRKPHNRKKRKKKILFSLAIHSVTFNLSFSTYFACITLHHSLKIKLDADPSDFWKER